jgi:hypothetical protein
MAPRPLSPEELDRLEARLDTWFDRQLADTPFVAAVERGLPGERRWYVRVLGQQKDVFTIWFTLRQRTLHYETYVMPAPEENHARFYEHLLRRNAGLYGAAFSIGVEDAVFLGGHLPVELADVDDELDRVLGSLYAWTEQFFRPALRIGFASKFS